MNKRWANNEKKELNTILEEKYNLHNYIDKKDLVDMQENIICVNNRRLFFYYETHLLPTLHLLLEKQVLKRITVDMGAVKFVIKGADIMRPGITKIEDVIKKDDIIVIIDETHGKPLAIGKALFDGETIKTMNSGKVIKNIHYIGDTIWRA